MNDLLKQRILRALDTLPDDRAYQVLDFVEFLESRYAERQRPTGFLAKITETVEDTMRAGKLPIQAISGTMGLMDSATQGDEGARRRGAGGGGRGDQRGPGTAEPSRALRLPSRRPRSSNHPVKARAEARASAHPPTLTATNS